MERVAYWSFLSVMYSGNLKYAKYVIFLITQHLGPANDLEALW